MAADNTSVRAAIKSIAGERASQKPTFGWQDTIARTRIDFDDNIKDSPSLRQRIPEWVEREQHAAARLVLFNLRQHGELTGEIERAVAVRHYTADEVLGDWFPRG